jgi:hypothetical protein
VRFVVVVVLSAIAGISPFCVGLVKDQFSVCSPLTIPANTCL